MVINTCRVLGKRERGKGKEKIFNLFPKPNSELKIQKPSSIDMVISIFDCLNKNPASYRNWVYKVMGIFYLSNLENPSGFQNCQSHLMLLDDYQR
ncbi:hypothetical protein NIES4072_27440 [Nostoc commune NIES-4072]|uniref:Uncharacterized protein n=1 Tax=Nostoc commune NIES-4072 TaxID=2005467 RepID=A0A2R5FJX9_NOSCO|nr:hypothetical protein NIES4070_63300 [Nostoc commune HK-02]GBG19077.1 hypothetical protein NIES4072_27440 [Nostoc commune NIES-4072]